MYYPKGSLSLGSAGYHPRPGRLDYLLLPSLCRRNQLKLAFLTPEWLAERAAVCSDHEIAAELGVKGGSQCLERKRERFRRYWLERSSSWWKDKVGARALVEALPSDLDSASSR
jgi:hypothetical protein